MPMTRLQIKVAALDLLGEDAGTTEPDRPYLMDTWVNTAADEIARATDCYYGSVTQEITQGQAIYSAPQVYKLAAAYWTDTTGQVYTLQQTTPTQLDQRFGYWRTLESGTLEYQGAPLYYAAEGANSLLLYPTPSTTSLIYAYTDLVIAGTSLVTSAARPFVSTDVGLTLRVTGGAGFAPASYTVVSVTGGAATLSSLPGAFASSGGQAFLSYGGLVVEGYLVPADSWPLATQNCPLPDRAHMAVVWRLAKFRAIQFPTPANVARIPLFDAEYKRALALLEAEAHRMTQATAHADLHRYPFAGGRY